MASRIVLQVDKAASADQEVLRHFGERGEGADLDRGIGIRASGHRQEASQPRCLALHFATGPLGHPLRENAFASSTCWTRKQMQPAPNNQPIESIHFLTGH